ncbi:5639_t:CDS:2, partial [Acaulospora colombiana]
MSQSTHSPDLRTVVGILTLRRANVKANQYVLRAFMWLVTLSQGSGEGIGLPSLFSSYTPQRRLPIQMSGTAFGGWLLMYSFRLLLVYDVKSYMLHATQGSEYMRLGH